MQATLLRNPRLDVLTEKQLKDYCPAIWAKEPRSDVSARYGFIPTYEILEAMHDAKLEPVEVRNYARKNSKDLRFTQHMVRFRQAGKLDARVVGDVVPQVVLLNSHDRSARFQLYGGLFRLVCANGLLVSENDLVAPYVVRHTKSAVEEVVGMAKQIIEHHGKIFQHVKLMRDITLTPRQRTAFAKSALELRPARPGLIAPDALLAPRRKEDEAPTLWNTFNVVQENLTKGGVPGATATGRRVQTGEIRSIEADMKLNAGVWSLAMQAIAKAARK